MTSYTDSSPKEMIQWKTSYLALKYLSHDSVTVLRLELDVFPFHGSLQG